uniref:Transposase n=1 Tax=Streptomyces sp. NBC_00093 TaxID=2975649 RepID=A0AAU2AB17_9ACTN
MRNRRVAAAVALSRRMVYGPAENIRAELALDLRARIAGWWTADQAPMP